MLFLSATEAMLWPQLLKLAPGQSMVLAAGVFLGRSEDGRPFLAGTFGSLRTGPAGDPCGPWCRYGRLDQAAG
ncbi:hypothetical protein LVY72_11080 [Arthrobacter sp. I2-34]|uniref:Uncharacterized protein n=1 Tax=Arthrobacter hankyongi TaxID=2904801 RepID=A0ABS9L6Z7_9MICC|nr:hypothetical protein [Arthrobacter hankyongi]MCG2622456.1 hypothetical protein [Arthrobacter hankyongi]